MRANELRIGNFVQDKRGNVLKMTLITMCIDDCRTDGNHVIHPIGTIPLTEEWLKRFGFENTYNQCWVKRTQQHQHWDQLTFEFIDDKFYFTGGEGWPMSKEFMFIHEIQNFWYALIGEELTIV